MLFWLSCKVCQMPLMPIWFQALNITVVLLLLLSINITVFLFFIMVLQYLYSLASVWKAYNGLCPGRYDPFWLIEAPAHVETIRPIAHSCCVWTAQASVPHRMSWHYANVLRLRFKFMSTCGELHKQCKTPVSFSPQKEGNLCDWSDCCHMTGSNPPFLRLNF